MEDAKDVLTCGVFDVSVIMEGEKLPQYGAEHEESEHEQKASCWIPSTAGKSFVIQCEKNEKNGESFVIKVFLDEHEVEYVVVQQDRKHITDRCYISDSEVRTFVFATLDLTDDDRYIENPPRQDIGTIRVEVQPVEVVGEVQNKAYSYSPPDVDKVHERSKKGLSHRINYGPIKQELKINKTVNIRPTGRKATMLFKYRPLEMLQANGIVSRVRSESEQEEDVKLEIIDLETDDDEDVEAKEKELLAQLEAVRNKKRARRDGEGARKKVKTESSHFYPGEVIDLTL